MEANLIFELYYESSWLKRWKKIGEFRDLLEAYKHIDYLNRERERFNQTYRIVSRTCKPVCS